DQFEDWLVQRSWNMHADSTEAAQRLASAIELRLAEHSSGHLDEAALRQELLPLVTTYKATVAFGEGATIIATDSTNNAPEPRSLLVLTEPQFRQRVDISPEGVSA